MGSVDSYGSRELKSKLLELVLQAILCYVVQFVQRKIRALAAEGETSPMHMEDGIVQISLRIREFAVDWECSCDVGDIASKFLCLDEHW